MWWAVWACSSRVAMMARTSWAASRPLPRRGDVQPVGLGVLVLCLPRFALVEVSGVGLAAAGQSDV